MLERFRQPAGALIPDLGRLERPLIAAGAVCGIVSLAGLMTNPAQFYQSYLMAYMWVLGPTLGCLALAMIHQLSGGAWGVLIRRPMGAASRVLPVLTVLFLPIVAGMPHLYVWTHADVVAADPVLAGKQAYLNTPFFLVRAVVYFAVWNLVSHFLNAWSLEQDRTHDPALSARMRTMSAVGLIAYVLTISFASFDWMMSTEPHWFSTIYGVLVLGGQGLSAVAFLAIVLVWLSQRSPINELVEVLPDRFHDVGNLMLAFVMLWAYFAFSQYLIIWSGNLPEEISWYQHRLQTGWIAIGMLLMLAHFAIPFVLLLSRVVKREARTLAAVAGFVILMRLVDLFWMIAPEFHRHGVAVSWLDVLLPASLGLIWLGCYAHQLAGRSILPLQDPEFEATLGEILERAAPAGGRQ
jgi:hypothetical protein